MGASSLFCEGLVSWWTQISVPPWLPLSVGWKITGNFCNLKSSAVQADSEQNTIGDQLSFHRNQLQVCEALRSKSSSPCPQSYCLLALRALLPQLSFKHWIHLPSSLGGRYLASSIIHTFKPFTAACCGCSPSLALGPLSSGHFLPPWQFSFPASDES